MDDRTEFLIDQRNSRDEEQYRILRLERNKELNTKLFPLFALAIILALYVCVSEIQLKQLEILITYVLIALTFGVMAIGYYYEYK